MLCKEDRKRHSLVHASALPCDAACLTRLHLTRTPSGLQEDEALEALRIMSAALSTAKLKHLNLSDNALGEKGVRAAADSFVGQVGRSKGASNGNDVCCGADAQYALINTPGF